MRESTQRVSLGGNFRRRTALIEAANATHSRAGALHHEREERALLLSAYIRPGIRARSLKMRTLFT